MKVRAAPLVLAVLSVAVCAATTGASPQPGGMIAFSTNRAKDLHRSVLYSVGDDGTGHKLVSRVTPPVTGLVRSPDGRRILFSRQVDGGLATFIARSSGSNAVRIDPAGADFVREAVFSPTSAQVAFTSYSGARGDAIYVINVDGTGLRQVADSGMSLSWSPDGRRLAYADALAVFVVDLSGMKLVRLADGSHPVWAPRGERIAYRSTLGGYDVLCIADSDGKRRRCARGRTTRNVLWSPDATRIAFGQLQGRLVIANPNARVLRVFVYRVTGQVSPGAWSPDGRDIAYIYSEYPRRAPQIYVRHLRGRSRPKMLTHELRTTFWDLRWHAGRISYVAQRSSNDFEIAAMRPDGRGVQILTHNAHADLEPAWSPDRQMITFSRRDGAAAGLRLIAADGSQERALTSDGFWDESPAWSPEGLRIAFVRTRKFGADAKLTVVNRDGTGLRELSAEIIYPGGLSWSSDGSFLVGVVARGTTSLQLFVVQADGNGFRRLSTGCEWAREPAWSPDGKRILFSGACASQSPVVGLFTIRPDGSGLTTITAGGGTGAWSPDGSRILFVRSHEDPYPIRNILLANADGTGEVQLTHTYSSNIEPAWSR